MRTRQWRCEEVVGEIEGEEAGVSWRNPLTTTTGVRIFTPKQSNAYAPSKLAAAETLQARFPEHERGQGQFTKNGRIRAWLP